MLRDFSLQLVDADGRPLAHQDYLEQALAADGGGKCATRAAIRGLFPERHLVTLPRPGRGESAQNLEQRGGAGVNAKFDKYLGTFRRHLLAHAAPVAAAGVPLTGATYAEHARALVARANEGAVPRIEDSWTLIARSQREAERLARAAAVAPRRGRVRGAA